MSNWNLARDLRPLSLSECCLPFEIHEKTLPNDSSLANKWNAEIRKRYDLVVVETYTHFDLNMNYCYWLRQRNVNKKWFPINSAWIACVLRWQDKCSKSISIELIDRLIVFDATAMSFILYSNRTITCLLHRSVCVRIMLTNHMVSLGSNGCSIKLITLLRCDYLTFLFLSISNVTSMECLQDDSLHLFVRRAKKKCCKLASIATTWNSRCLKAAAMCIWSEIFCEMRKSRFRYCVELNWLQMSKFNICSASAHRSSIGQ